MAESSYVPAIEPFHEEDRFVVYEREGGGFTVAVKGGGRTYRCSKLEDVVRWVIRQGLAHAE